jgi:hypothetical protein
MLTKFYHQSNIKKCFFWTAQCHFCKKLSDSPWTKSSSLFSSTNFLFSWTYNIHSKRSLHEILYALTYLNFLCSSRWLNIYTILISIRYAMFCNLFGTLASPDGIPCVESFEIEVSIGARPCTKIIWWEYNYCTGRDHDWLQELPHLRYLSPNELPHLSYSSQRDYLKYRIHPNGTTSDMTVFILKSTTSSKAFNPKGLSQI